MEVQYNRAELEAAALYVSMFNIHINSTYEQVLQHIEDCIILYAKDQDCKTMQTMGYMLAFLRDDVSDIVEVDIMVDPTILFDCDGYLQIKKELE